MKFNKHRDIHEAEFDLTAMIDVVFLLIIFFMLSSHFARIQLAPMPLPEQPGEERGSFENAQRTIIIDLGIDGALTVLDVGRVSPEALVGLVERGRRTRSGTDAELEVVVRAHRQAAAGHLNRLAGTLARAGVRTWKLATSGTGAAGSGVGGSGGGGGGGGA